MAPVPLHGDASLHLAPHAKSTLAIAVVCSFFSLLAVTLVGVSHRVTKTKFFFHEWLIFLATAVYLGYITIVFVDFYRGGLGWHLPDLGTSELQVAFGIILAEQVLYAISMGLLKVAICLLIAHLFHHLPSMRRAAYSLIALSVAWTLMTILIGFLICRPLAYQFDKSIPGGTCGDESNAFAAVSIIDIALDIMILVLPLRRIWSLQMQVAKKISISAMFGLGFITILFTCFRLKDVLETDFTNISYSAIEPHNWTIIEWSAAIIVACGPGIKPLAEKLFKRNSRSGQGNQENRDQRTRDQENRGQENRDPRNHDQENRTEHQANYTEQDSICLEHIRQGTRVTITEPRVDIYSFLASTRLERGSRTENSRSST